MNTPVNGSEEPQYTGWFDAIPAEGLRIRDVTFALGAAAANTVETKFASAANRVKQLAVLVGEGYIRFEYDFDKPVCPEKLLQRAAAMEFSDEPITIDDSLLCNQVVCQGPVKSPRVVAGISVPFSGKKQCGIVRSDNL